MLPLISLTTQFLLVALVVTAVGLGMTVGYFLLRSRRSDQEARLSGAEQAELRQRDQEIAAIRTRIEEIYERQQTGSETQHAMIHQRIEQMHRHLKARSRQIDGLQSQLQFEIQRREDEMKNLRMHLEAAVSSKAAPALPEASATTPPETRNEEEGITPFPVDELLTFDRETQDETGAPLELEPVAMESPSPTPATNGTHAIQPDTSSPAPRQASIEKATPMREASTTPRTQQSRSQQADAEDPFSWEPVELNFSIEDSPVNGDSAPGNLHDPKPEEDASPRQHPSTPAERPHPQFETLIDLFGEVPDEEATDALEHSATPQPDPVDASDDASASDDTFGDLIQWTFMSEDPDLAATAPTPSTRNGESKTTAETPVASISRPFSGGDGVPSERATPSTPRPITGHADDLKVLPMIDEKREQLIHGLGVHSIEEIARWSRADARRVIDLLPEISEEEIMNEWIFAAQSVLFERYQAEMRTRVPV